MYFSKHIYKPIQKGYVDNTCICEGEMGILESIYRAVTVPKFNEERLYEQVYEELSDNQIRIGLWTKALSESYGDECAAKSIYIKLRVESIKEELIVWEKEQYKEAKRLEKEQKHAEEARKLAEYKATHSNVVCKFCGRNQDVKNTEINYKKCDYCSNLISKAKHEYLFVYCRNCKTEFKCDKTTNIDKLINSKCNNCNKILYKKGIIFNNAIDLIYYCKHCNYKNSFKHDADLNSIICSECNSKFYTFFDPPYKTIACRRCNQPTLVESHITSAICDNCK